MSIFQIKARLRWHDWRGRNRRTGSAFKESQWVKLFLFPVLNANMNLKLEKSFYFS